MTTPCPKRRIAWAACAAFGLFFASLSPAFACRTLPSAQPGALSETVVTSQPDVTAWYADLTQRYGHAVLGDGLEPTTLAVLTGANSASCGVKITLAAPHVFEDVAPRLVDLTNDGIPEVITVRSHEALGAQIAVYALSADQLSLSLLATTPYIGTRFRWLAPLGAADLDGDGALEIAYVDRPHLAKTLRIWRFQDGQLAQVASSPGVTNHRIGESDIAGGIRDCGSGFEMILANSTWSALLALRFDGGEIVQREIDRDTSRASFARAMVCNR